MSNDDVVVCFDGWYPAPSLLGRPFGYEFLRSENINVISIKSGLNDWYQNAEILDVLAAVDAAAGSRRRKGYGVSMGAYGALNFADWLKLDSVLACAPQFSVDSAKVPFELRWPIDRANINFIHDRIAEVEPVPGHLIVDNSEPEDRQHGALILEHHPLHRILMPFGGHSVLEALHYSGCLRQVIVGLLRGTLSSNDVIRLRRAGRHGNRLYWTTRSAAMARAGKLEAALDAAKQARTAQRGPELAADCQYAEILYLTGQRAQAIEVWSKGLSNPETEPATSFLIRLAVLRWSWGDTLSELGLPP